MNMSPLVFLLLSIVFTSCSIEDTNDSSEVNFTTEIREEQIEETILNVAYGLHDQQVFDVYLPHGRTTTNTKVLIVVHGGSWMGGDKNSLTNFVLDLKEKHPNHAIVNINYVLGSETHYAFPNQFLDINKVLNFIKLRKQEYQIKPEFGLIGSSSGGQLALQYAYKYDLQNDVKFVGSFGGTTDFLDSYYEEKTNTEQFELLIDKEYYYNTMSDWTIDIDDIDFLKLLSPAYEVSEESTPTILFYGEQDTIIPLSNGEMLNDQLVLHNISTSFNIFQGGHGGWNAESYKETMHVILEEFIDAHLYVSDF
jgi:acetyl esterase/lipase